MIGPVVVNRRAAYLAAMTDTADSIDATLDDLLEDFEVPDRLELAYAISTHKAQGSQFKRVVHSANLSIAPGETLALVGGSGSGKTTLGRAIVGLNSPCSGAIEFEGVDILKAGNRDHRLQCQMIFQDPYSSLDPRMKIGDILAEPLRHVPGMTPAQRRERVAKTLVDIGLAEQFVERFPHQLSGGQRQRVAIGRALVRHPRLVIADEPISALDMTIQKQILELFERLQAQYGFACLFISHDLGVVAHLSDTVSVMRHGRVVESGTTAEVFTTPRSDYTAELLAAIPGR